MATPYQVPSLSDIMYTRSRTPTPQQVTLNNLMSFLNNAQQIKSETEAERSRREFTTQSDREEREWRSGEEAKRRAVEEEREGRRRIERRLDKVKADRLRAEDNTRRDADITMGHLIRAYDSRKPGQAKMILQAYRKDFIDAGRGKDVEYYDSMISDLETRIDGEQTSLMQAYDTISDRGASPEDLFKDETFRKYATPEARNIIYNHMGRDWDQLTWIERNELLGQQSRITGKYESALKAHEIARTDPLNYDEDTGAPMGPLINTTQDLGRVEQELSDLWQRGRELLPSRLKGKEKLSDYKYGPDQFDDALRVWIPTTKPQDSKGQIIEIANDESMNYFRGLKESGDLKEFYNPDGHMSHILLRHQWEKAGLTTPQKLPKDPVDPLKRKTMDEFGKELEERIQVKIEDGIPAKGAPGSGAGKVGMGGYAHNISYLQDIKDPTGKAYPLDEASYVPNIVREYAGVSQEIYDTMDGATAGFKQNINKYKKGVDNDYQKEIRTTLLNSLDERDAGMAKMLAMRDKIQQEIRNPNIDKYERLHFVKLLQKITREITKVDNFFEYMRTQHPELSPPERVFP